MLDLFWENLHCMFIDMAFYIMLGLFFVGLLNTYVKREKVLGFLGKDDVSSVVKASVIGVPLPLCSCGVVPTAVELKKSGASNGAVTSFLVSTPQTGVDSILATYSMMGIIMAVFRPMAAFASGIITGTLVNIFAKDEQINIDGVHSCCSSEPAPAEGGCCCSSEPAPAEGGCCCSSEPPPAEGGCCCSSEPPPAEGGCCCSSEPTPAEGGCCCSSEPAPTEGGSCCSSEPAPTEGGCCCSSEPAPAEGGCCCSSEPAPAEGGCCSTKPKADLSTLSPTAKFLRVFQYAYGEFLDGISFHFVIGLLLATVIATFVPADFFVSLGLNSGIIAMLAMVLVGLPMYICSTSSIPIALSLLTKGLSLGSAFVFLFTGPVTNIASILMLSTVLGKKITTIYITLVVACSVGFGLLLDQLISVNDISTVTQISSAHHHSGSYMTVVALIFLVLLIRSLIKVIPAKIKSH